MGDPTKNPHRNVSNRSVILIKSKSKERYICSMCTISMCPVTKYCFCVFYFRFRTQELKIQYFWLWKIYFHNHGRCYNDFPHYTSLLCHTHGNAANYQNFRNPEAAEQFLHSVALPSSYTPLGRIGRFYFCDKQAHRYANFHDVFIPSQNVLK